MPCPSQYALSRRALLAGGAAVLAGCSADDPHDGDPDAETVTAAPVPMTGPERLAAIEQSDLPTFESPSLVTDAHLAERLDDVEALARDVEELLEETPTAAELAGRRDETSETSETSGTTGTSGTSGTSGTATATTHQDDDRGHEDRLDRIERVRRQARDAVVDARHLLQEERERDGRTASRHGYDTTNEMYLTRANHRVARLSVSLWMVRVAHDRATVAELPEPTDVEANLRDVRASIEYRCDGSGLQLLYLSEVELTLRSALRSIADFEEHAGQRFGSDDSEDAGGEDGGIDTTHTTSGRGQSEELPVDRIHETVSAHAQARMRLLDARQYLAEYETRIGDAPRCGDRLRATIDDLRSRVAQQHRSLGDRLPAREDVDRSTENAGDRSSPRRLVRPVRRRLAMPEEYHERQLSRTEAFEQNGWVALPCRVLARHLLWYRSIATAIERLPAGTVDPAERLELVTTTHESAVQRFTAAIDGSGDDPLARRYLRYAASALGRAEEILTSFEPDAIDSRDGHQQLVRAYTLLLQADGIATNALPVSKLVRPATSGD